MSMDNVYLMGSEDVMRAGVNISGAAEKILQAANLILESVNYLERIMEIDRQERERLLNRVIDNEHGDEHQTWYEIWTEKASYFYEDDDSACRYKDLEEVEKALKSIDKFRLGVGSSKNLRTLKVIQVRIEVSV